MPLISSFYGILVYMFKELGGVHKRPHIHAVFGAEKLSIAFDGEILAGALPRKQQKLVEAWVALHEDELRASWIALNENGEVLKIRGLE
jgi:hypothetical protein